jgi:hypothetical protein
VDVDDLETPPDEAAVTKEAVDLVRGGVGGDVEVLGLAAQEQIPHPAPDHIGGVTVIVEPCQDLEDIGGHRRAGDGVLLAGDDPGTWVGTTDEFL